MSPDFPSHSFQSRSPQGWATDATGETERGTGGNGPVPGGGVHGRRGFLDNGQPPLQAERHWGVSGCPAWLPRVGLEAAAEAAVALAAVEGTGRVRV